MAYYKSAQRAVYNFEPATRKQPPVSAATTAGGRDSVVASLQASEVTYPVKEVPTDSVSQVAWSPGFAMQPAETEYLAASSWDGSVKLYQVDVAVNGQSAAQIKSADVVLDWRKDETGIPLRIKWHPNGTKLFVAGSGKAAHVLDLSTQQAVQVGAHDLPIRCLTWVTPPSAPGGLLLTGSWDKTLRYWDTRSPTPALTVELPERCYALDSHSLAADDRHNFVAVATAGPKVLTFDMKDPTKANEMTCILTQNITAISCFADTRRYAAADHLNVADPYRIAERRPDAATHTQYFPGFAVAGSEGRLSFKYLDAKETDTRYSYNFRLHREDVPPKGTKKGESVAYPVHDVVFNPVYPGLFATCGGDGKIMQWHRDHRAKTLNLNDERGPVTSLSYNRTGRLLAYSVSYDWSKGFAETNRPVGISILPMREEWCYVKRLRN